MTHIAKRLPTQERNVGFESIIRAGRLGLSRRPRIEVDISVEPSIPEMLDDGTLPIEAISDGLLVLAPTGGEGGFLPRAGDVFLVAVNDIPIAATAQTLIDSTPNPMQLVVPASFFKSLDDGFHTISYIVTVSPSVTAQSLPVNVLVDRKPSGGSLLPRIIFEEHIERDGISAAELVSRPDQSIPVRIPDYRHQAAGDVIEIFYCSRNSSLAIAHPPINVMTDAQEITAMFTLSDLERVEDDGIVDFFYRVTDRAHNVSAPSPRTPVRSNAKYGPRVMYKADVKRVEGSVVLDHDIRPQMHIAIPQCDPPSRDGDYVGFSIGTEQFMAGPLKLTDSDKGLIGDISLTYADAWSLVPQDGRMPFDAPINYALIRTGVASKGPSSTASFNFSLPGGQDPNPATPENEALVVPLLRSAGGEDNVIKPDDLGNPAKIILQHATSPDTSLGLVDGDRVTMEVDTKLISLSVLVRGNPSRLEIDVPPGYLRDYRGQKALSYQVERRLEEGVSINVRSRAQNVSIYSQDMLPGDGLPLSPSKFVLPGIDEVGGASYILLSAHLRHPENRIRIYSYTNMLPGDLVSIDVTGFDGVDGGQEVGRFSLTYMVKEDDLEARADMLRPKDGMLVYFDVPVGSAGTSLLPIRYGRAETVYSVSNKVGRTESEVDRVIVRNLDS
ncbi:hypothetical protein KPL74_06830 [Bacillus sp. NP157]|nr:hypothetical protein KPL74_06830 [Bacillus sp. NP157]